MNGALIAIGCRNEVIRAAALAAAERIGPVDVDHGDTACDTPDARASIEKAWASAAAKGAVSPAAQEQKRDLPRRRCGARLMRSRNDQSPPASTFMPAISTAGPPRGSQSDAAAAAPAKVTEVQRHPGSPATWYMTPESSVPTRRPAALAM